MRQRMNFNVSKLVDTSVTRPDNRLSCFAFISIRTAHKL